MNRYLLICLVLLIMACKRNEKPEPLPVPREKFIDVLVDMHVMNSLLQRYSGPVQDSLRTVYTDQIFDIHSISKAKLDSMMGYLKREPGIAEELYKEVLDEMTLLGNK